MTGAQLFSCLSCGHWSMLCRRAQIITDLDGIIIVVKVRPMKGQGPLWEFVLDSVEEQLAILHEELGKHAALAAAKENGTDRTDGSFFHTTCGLSMGGGQPVRLVRFSTLCSWRAGTNVPPSSPRLASTITCLSRSPRCSDVGLPCCPCVCILFRDTVQLSCLLQGCSSFGSRSSTKRT